MQPGVALINPPRDNLVHLDLPQFVDLGEISSFPPIGLMYLAQALREKMPSSAISIIDCVAENLNHSQIAAKIAAEAPAVVGLTAFTYTFYDVLKTARAIKQFAPNIPIVVGGPHMYLFAAETMTHAVFDYGVVGDGEHVFTALCETIIKERPLPQLPGLMSRKNGQVVGTGIAQLEDLDHIQIPAVDLIDPFKYYSTIGPGQTVGAICTSRGCPFQCTFCQVPRTRYRMRAIENIIKEIKAYTALGISDFFFFDDLFNITSKRVVDFCKAIFAENLKITWMFRGRVDQIDDKTVKIARKAGCHTISIGIEDATDAGLRAIKKNISIHQAYQAVRAITQNKVRCSANWIIGLPSHQRPQDLAHLLKTAIDIKADYAQFSILQCLPGSELFDQAVAAGGLDALAWRRYTLNPSKDFAPPIWERYFKKEVLYEFYTQAFRKYYLRPGFIVRQALAIRSRAELKKALASFFKVFVKK